MIKLVALYTSAAVSVSVFLQPFQKEPRVHYPVTKRLVWFILCPGAVFCSMRLGLPCLAVARVTIGLTGAAIPTFTHGSLQVAPCSAVTSSEMVSKFPAALAESDVPTLTRGSVLAGPLGVVVLFTTVAYFPAASADWDVRALTREPLLAAPRFVAAVSLRQQILLTLPEATSTGEKVRI